MYSHDKTYLPPGRWWDDDDKRDDIRYVSKGPVARENPAFMPCIFAIVDNRIAWTPAHAAHAAEMEEASAHFKENMLMLKYFGDIMDDGDDYATYRSMGRRSRGQGRSRGQAGNWGFTDDDVQELLCQGVKPWDEDARVSFALI